VLTVDQEPRLKITNLHQDARSPRHAKLERGGHRSSVWNSVLIDASRALAQDGSGPNDRSEGGGGGLAWLTPSNLAS
jgi:hypothetical protein